MTTPPTSLVPDRWRVVRKRELLHLGHSEAAIDAAWRDGRLLRVRHGLYAHPDAHPEVLRAVRVGGALGGSSAGALWGIWTPHSYVLTVSVPHNARRLRDPDDPSSPLDPARRDVAILRDGHLHAAEHERAIVSPTTVVVQALAHLEPRLALAVIDSALRLAPSLRPDLAIVRARTAGARRSTLLLADSRAESGTESVFRYGLHRAGLDFEPQVWLTDDIRVDFVVAGFVVVECQSREHHSSPDRYNRDRERISTIVRLGYVVLEFTYAQVMFDWEGVWAAMLAALRLKGAALVRPRAEIAT